MSGSSWFKIRENVVKQIVQCPACKKDIVGRNNIGDHIVAEHPGWPGLVTPVKGLPSDLSSGLTRTEGEYEDAYKRGCIDTLENLKYALDILENSGSGFEWRALIDHLIEDMKQ